MAIKRRTALGILALSIGMACGAAPAWAETTTVKISHQFPGGTIDKGDFRDRLVRMFAAEVEKRSKGSLKFEIYPGSSLMKTNAQFSAMRKGALDMSLVPLSYAGGEVPETNIGLMPGLVTSYEQSAAWKNAAVGKELTKILLDKGVVMVSWIWQAGGMASRGKPIVEPEDAKGMKIRGGSREMDLILKEAGAAVVTLPSNEIYAGMQTGAMDAALTSSTSLISFRLEEVSKALTTGRGKSYWFMLEPLMMSKAAFDRLSKEQQALVMQVGAEMEAFALKEAKADDEEVAKVFAKAGAKPVDLTEATVKKWQDIARRTAWKDFAAKNANTAKLLQLAEQVK
ncbi:MAG: TRAP transporter substrate-binding protein DctP [Telluria sp.]